MHRVVHSALALSSLLVMLVQGSRGDQARLKEAVAKHGLQVLAGPGFFETGEITFATHSAPSRCRRRHGRSCAYMHDTYVQPCS